MGERTDYSLTNFITAVKNHHSKYLYCICSGKNLATALSRHGIKPGSLIPVESEILSNEPQQLARDI